MNRPAVRHVRALRTERELDEARRAHAAARQARREAASRRLLVACALAGVLAGVCVVAAVTVLPWWVALVPGALLGGSMVAGRRAAMGGQAADRREQRRIASLEAEYDRLTGVARTPAVVRSRTSSALPAQRDEVRGRVAGEPAAASAAEAAQRETDNGGVLPVVVPDRAAAAVETVHEASAASAASAGGESREAHVCEARRPEPEARAPRREDGLERPAADAAEQVRAAVATPPQGWKPVSVPAPTYTLVASARGRRIDELGPVAGDEQSAASVPMRPVSVRTFAPAPPTPAVQPIDLDAVLARRRAAGE